MMLVGSLQAANVSCEWTVDGNPTTLADGAVTITYNGEGAIQSIVASPANGDTITMTGDELPFAAGAKIQVETESRLVISNTIVCAGDLTVTGCAATVVRSWNDGVASTLPDSTQALLPTNSFRLMFENMDLDEWEPVEFRGDIPANIGAGWYFPNHFKAQYFKRKTIDGEKFMEVDLMAMGTSAETGKNWTKAISILLHQNGGNVEGKTVNAWYGNSLYEGMSAEEASMEYTEPLHLFSGGVAVPGSRVGGYGVSQLTMKRADVPAVCVFANGLSLPQERKVAVAGHIHVECAICSAIPGFNVDGTLSLVGGPAVGSSLNYMNGDISGTGTVIVDGRDTIRFTVEKTSENVPPDQEYAHESYVGATLYTRNMVNRQLHSLTNAVAEFYGSECPTKPKARLYHLKETTPSTGESALVGQFQGISGGNLYCFYAIFEQIGNDIKIRADKTAWKVQNTGANHEGMDFDSVKGTAAATSLVVVESWNGNGISMRSPRFYFATMRSGILCNRDFGNGMSGNPRFVVRGSISRTQVYQASYSNAVPSCGTIEVDAGGELHMMADGVLGKGYNGGKALMRIRSGGNVLLGGKNLFHDTQNVILDGGGLTVRKMPNVNYGSGPYLQYLVLKDGARVSGGGLLMGNRVVNPYIGVCGESPSFFDSTLTLQATSNNGHRYFNWRISDVTGDEEADFVMNGTIRCYNFGSSLATQLSTNTTMRKYGDGTILLKGMQNQSGRTEIHQGEWRFGASGIGNGTGYILYGGRIGAEDGTSNELGALRVENGAGSIVLGEDASLSFADTSSIAWSGSGKVLIDYDGELKAGMLRFGTSKNGLTSAQLARIRHNGNRVMLNDEGYMLDQPKTFRIIVR